MKKRKAEKTADGRIIVDSRAYGKHVRAARGTHKQAEVNEAFKASSALLARANQDGRLIKKELERYCGAQKPRLLWQRLLSVLRAGYRQGEDFKAEVFKGFDVYEEYKISRLLTPQCSIYQQGSNIGVQVYWQGVPKFNRKFPEGYMFAMVCIMVDRENDHSESCIEYSETFPLDHDGGAYEFGFSNIDKGQYSLLFLILNATKKGKMSDNMATSGFRCVWGGSFGEGRLG